MVFNALEPFFLIMSLTLSLCLFYLFSFSSPFVCLSLSLLHLFVFLFFFSNYLRILSFHFPSLFGCDYVLLPLPFSQAHPKFPRFIHLFVYLSFYLRIIYDIFCMRLIACSFVSSSHLRGFSEISLISVLLRKK